MRTSGSSLLLSAPYEAIYTELRELRELFHSEGTIEDSNAKLDEITSLVYCIHKSGVELFDSVNQENCKDVLSKALDNLDGRDNTKLSRRILGETNSIVLSSIKISCEIVKSYRIGSGVDLMNEVFGHFIRDNFRGNVEDAQYMTPPEVASAMARIASIIRPNTQSLIVLDPSCGVGTLLTEVYRAIKSGGESTVVKLFGQDRVERMSRLTRLNTNFSGIPDQLVEITTGNSLAYSSDSPISSLVDSVDIIITNPPFGAKVDEYTDKLTNGQRAKRTTISSELAFMRKYHEFLKNDGILIAVMPDSFISSRGNNQIIRGEILKQYDLMCVIELPSITFGQAGTRTNTSIVVLKKNGKANSSKAVFVKINDLGFNVKQRKGVNIKFASGENELQLVMPILEDFLLSNTRTDNYHPSLITEKPLVISVPSNLISSKSWKLHSYLLEERKSSQLYSSRTLSDISSFKSRERSVQQYDNDYFYISVLHIINEGVIDYKELFSYKPITPGRQVFPGEVIFSRLNPRNIRAYVVPDLGRPLLCSNEFEIIEPKDGIDPYEILFLLYSSDFHSKVSSLTSGSSSSHNRVKSEALGNISLIAPDKLGISTIKWNDIISRYSDAIKRLNLGMLEIMEIKSLS